LCAAQLTRVVRARSAKAAFGYTPAFRCRSGKLTEAWHFHETTGRSTSADAFTRVAPISGTDNCPSSGISWVPKS
jgi:ribonuclease T2